MAKNSSVTFLQSYSNTQAATTYTVSPTFSAWQNLKSFDNTTWVDVK